MFVFGERSALLDDDPVSFTTLLSLVVSKEPLLFTNILSGERGGGGGREKDDLREGEGREKGEERGERDGGRGKEGTRMMRGERGREPLNKGQLLQTTKYLTLYYMSIIRKFHCKYFAVTL